jgi:hypothetical protein
VINAQLTAVWNEGRLSAESDASATLRMAEDPTKIPHQSTTQHIVTEAAFAKNHPEKNLGRGRKPHRRFIERVRRDYMVDLLMQFYELVSIRLETDILTQTTGVAKDTADVLKAVLVDDKATLTTVEDALRRIDALWQACERVGIIPFTKEAGPIRYMVLLQQHSDKHPGLQHLLAADRKVRGEFHLAQEEDPVAFRTMEAAIKEVLDNRRHLWTDAIQEVMCGNWDKQAKGGDGSPGTPTRRPQRVQADTPNKNADKKRRQRENKKVRSAHLKWKPEPSPRPSYADAKGKGKGKKGDGKGKGKGGKGGKSKGKMPDEEWCKLMSINNTRGGRRVCRFWNSSIGCTFGDACMDLHECLQCPGENHKFSIRHG